jgi:hypothetical protein
VVSRYFYELARKVLSHLLLPLLSAYVIYRLVAYLIALGYGAPVGFLGTSQELPGVHVLFLDLAIFGLLVIIIFALFFFVIRHTLHKKLGALGSGEALRVSPAQISQGKIEAILKGKNPAPMSASLDPTAVDVFVSGHTHLPSLFKVERSKARKSMIVNSGCWLRQLQPVPVHFKGPPVFVSTFVLTHVRVYAKANSLQIELWKKQKAAPQRLSRLERLLTWGNRPLQPSSDYGSHVQSASSL